MVDAPYNICIAQTFLPYESFAVVLHISEIISDLNFKITMPANYCDARQLCTVPLLVGTENEIKAVCKTITITN
jgi:hypothetical protein